MSINKSINNENLRKYYMDDPTILVSFINKDM